MGTVCTHSFVTFSCGIENILFCRMPPRKRKEAQNDGPSAKKSKLLQLI